MTYRAKCDGKRMFQTYRRRAVLRGGHARSWRGVLRKIGVTPSVSSAMTFRSDANGWRWTSED